MTPEQQRALAIAAARKRQAEAQAPLQKSPLEMGNLGRANAALQGAGQAITGGFLDEMVDIPAAAISAIGPTTFGQEYAKRRESGQDILKGLSEEYPVSTIGGGIAGGLLGAGAIGATQAGRTLGGMLGSGNTGARIAKGILSSGAAGALYGAGGADTGERAQGAAQGGLLGAAIGGAIPAVSGLAGAIKKNVMPKLEGPAKQAAQNLNNLAKKHGIDLEVSDIAGSNRYKRLVAQGKSLPLSGAEDATEKTQVQINRAVSKTLGEEADKITPEYLDGVRKNLGTQFQDFTKGKEFSVTADAYTKIDDIANIASRKGYGAEGEALVNQYKSELESLVDDRGLIKGDKLDKFRRDLSAVARKQATSDIGQVASDFEDAVVDIIADSDPAISKAITDAKYKYKNYKVLLNPAARNQATGDISPASLSGAVQRVYGVDKFATGRAGDLGEIARVGQSLRKPSTSGTAENLMSQRGLIEHTLRLPQYAGNAMLQTYNRNPENVSKILNQGTNLPALPQSVLRQPIGAGMLGGYLGSQ